MSIADSAAALSAAHTAANTQETDITTVIKRAEQAHARLRDAAAGAANPLAERAMDSYTDAITKIREGAALLADVTDVLAEYARTAATDLPASNARRLLLNRRNTRPTGYPDDAPDDGDSIDNPPTDT